MEQQILKKKGGIQKGTTASTKESIELDTSVKKIAQSLAKTNKKFFYEAGHSNRGSKPETIERNSLPEFNEMGFTLGCMPDGGMWFTGSRGTDGRALKYVFEAKHQQDAGNAIERWTKNYVLCKSISPDVVYVTFASGEGARPGGVLQKFGDSMKAAFGNNVVFHYSVDGFTPESILKIMSDTMGLNIQ